MKITALLFFVALSACSTVAPTFAADASAPNRSLTPGAVFPVTIADVCVEGYTKVVRHVTSDVRKQAYAAYGEENVRGQHELDHLISLELGGSNALQNLWPEPYHGVWNAHVKDQLENHLHAMVCATPQQMSLSQAQKLISTDWIATYKQYIGAEPTTSHRRHHRRETRVSEQ